MIPTHPYRTNARREDAPRAKGKARGTTELSVPFAILWGICILHVFWVIARHATFGGGDTLALALVVVLPWLLFRAR